MGRRDTQVKVGARRIELGEVEAHLNAVPGVRGAVAVARTTAAGNTVLVGYVVGHVEPGDVRASVAERLPEGLAPVVMVMDGLPTRVSGKVDRDALPWPPPDGDVEDSTRAKFALGPTAAWLAERWGEQLGTYPTTADSDFFTLGGTSVMAAKLSSSAAPNSAGPCAP